MIIGIDLGTSNSLVGVFQEGRVQLVPNPLGKVLTPSVVGLSEDGSILIGEAARSRLVTHPHLTAGGFKRFMGSARTYRLGKQTFKPEELSALVLKALKSDAERYLGCEPEGAVITVPAYFRDAQRKATRLAGELAGLKVERIINEPTAAALAYDVHREEDERRYLVFDLGGGTFDVSVLDYFDGVTEVRSSAGDNYLGGDDFVTEIVRDIRAQCGISFDCTPPEEGKLRSLAQTAKHGLTERQSISFSFDIREKNLEYSLDRARFAEICDALLTKMRRPIEIALRDARLRPSELDDVLLVGGATRMPIVREMVARLFGRLPAFSVSPDEAVAIGAAIQGALKARDAAVQDRVLTDVAPFTLGVGVAERDETGELETDVLLPIIERNTVIPASRVHRLATVAARQKEMDLEIYQGESRKASSNVKLGRIRVRVPPDKAGEQTIDVRFTYDVNGILEVDVVTKIGTEYRLVIEETPGALSEAEVKQSLERIAHLKIHPAEQARNRTLLARLERLYEESIADRRRLAGALLSSFQRVLAEQDPVQIERRYQEIEKDLSLLETSIFDPP